ncbi:hypothetical protein [Xanthomonas fragariae]|uniref:hypothetical protein n=1 Tax=Xanthomonas fragariae TaxID=48664 RepID=UPI000826022F|nr:hypothetical protein [Xanthomonas fragariae]AOD18054.1 hypothetical protein BER93_07890 [Xanthomonas fragariae]MBL9195937.1 hypothetical protein [Xanthomonas fragariae]
MEARSDMYADDIKAILVSALLPNLVLDEILGSEVRFGDGKFRADLVISSPLRLSAIEIKGPRDNLDKLVDQASGYLSFFLDFSVASDDLWLPAIRDRMPRSAGLMMLRGSELLTVRAPRVRRRLKSEEALKWLHTDDLRKLLREQGISPNGHYEALCLMAKANFSELALSKYAIRAVYERLLPRFEIFRNELGRTVTLDDIRMLTLSDQISGRF